MICLCSIWNGKGIRYGQPAAILAFLLMAAGCDSVENEPPFFVSKPPELAVAGAAYRYTVRLADNDDDRVYIVMSEGPAWLSLTPESMMTAILSGTPERKDVGTAEILLQASDGQTAVDQLFTITVGYDFGGTYSTDHYVSAGFFSNCHHSESEPGGYYRIMLTPFGEATVAEKFRASSQESVFTGPYAVSADTLTITYAASADYSVEFLWLIDLPELRHLHTSSLPDACQPFIVLTME